MVGLKVPRNAIYVLTIAPRVCACQTPAPVFATGRNLDRIITVATGYWSVWDGFFGDQQLWLEFLVIDTRDGRVVWRNGRREDGVQDGDQQEQAG